MGKYDPWWKKNQSIEIYSEITQMIELGDANIKTVIITLPYVREGKGKTDCVKERHRRYFLKTQIEILKMKTIMSEIKIHNIG